VYLFAGEGMDEALIIAPSDFSLLEEREPFSLPRIFQYLADWLGV
jgi:hypothetical protein